MPGQRRGRARDPSLQEAASLGAALRDRTGLGEALPTFAAKHNALWLRQRYGYKRPDQIGAQQKALEPEAATEVKMAA